MKHATHAVLLASLLTAGVASVAHAETYVPLEELSTIQLNPVMAGALATPGVIYTIAGNQFISKGSTGCANSTMEPNKMLCSNVSLYLGPSRTISTSEGSAEATALYPVGISYMLDTSSPKNLVTVVSVRHVILPVAVATTKSTT